MNRPENIAYGKPKATREEIIAFAKSAKVDYFIRTMPQAIVKDYELFMDFYLKSRKNKTN